MRATEIYFTCEYTNRIQMIETGGWKGGEKKVLKFSESARLKCKFVFKGDRKLEINSP